MSSEGKKALLVLGIVMSFSASIMGISYAVYLAIEKNYISLVQGIIILLVFLLSSITFLIIKAKE